MNAFEVAVYFLHRAWNLFPGPPDPPSDVALVLEARRLLSAALEGARERSRELTAEDPEERDLNILRTIVEGDVPGEDAPLDPAFEARLVDSAKRAWGKLAVITINFAGACVFPVGPERTWGAGPVMCGKPPTRGLFCDEHGGGPPHRGRELACAWHGSGPHIVDGVCTLCGARESSSTRGGDS